MSKSRPALSPAEKRALPYRPCVGAVVVNKEGLVWLGRRLPNEEYSDQTLLWQFPQGGIDEGEDAQQAALRELYEETSIKSVSLLTDVPGWLNYDLPEELIGIALKGKYRGQKQRWFIYRFDGSDDEINVINPPDGNSAEFDSWDWVPLESVTAKTVSFKQPIYAAIVDHLRGHDAIRWSDTG